MGTIEEEVFQRAQKELATRQKKEVEPKRTSFLEHNGKLYEQVLRNNVPKFFEYDPERGKISEVSQVRVGEDVFFPLDGDDVAIGAVQLPTSAEEYGTTTALLEEIEAHIYRYLDVSSTFRKLATYYVLLTWVYDRFHTIPYLRALGDTGSGKSRFLDVIGGLCYKPIFASGCVTPAPIYRMLQRWGGTLILDEADFKNSDEYNEVVTILNCGFERGRPVIRAQKDNPDKIQAFEVFGPKVFATRNHFKDPALEARCLTEVMVETQRDDIPPDLGTTDCFKEQEKLRNKLLLWRFRNYFKVSSCAVPVPLPDLEPRLRQISSSFLSLFAENEKALKSFLEFIYQHQAEIVEQRANTLTGQVVTALLNAAKGSTTVVDPEGEVLTRVSCKDIVEVVKDLDVRRVGQILKTLGLKTKLARVDGKVGRFVAYDKRRFAVLARRYLVPDRNMCNMCNMRNGDRENLEQRGECGEVAID
jgi:hypothetical protein